MITGIIGTILFVIVCLRLVDKRILKKRGIFTKKHLHISIALAVVMTVHIVMTVLLWASRPMMVVLTGTAAVLSFLTACISGISLKKQAKAPNQYQNKIKLHRISAVSAALFIVLHIILNIIGITSYQNQVRNTIITEVDLSEIPDGTYQGEYDATFIYAKVEVTVKANQMTDITILEHRNERGKAAESIVTEMLGQQKIDVDAISHATNSSTVIKKAVENALLHRE